MRSDHKLRTIEVGAQVGGIKYTSITSTPYTVDLSDVIVGTNILGVNASADATINIPTTTDPRNLIHVQNESDTYSLTINFI